jgi:hypothetical protein
MSMYLLSIDLLSKKLFARISSGRWSAWFRTGRLVPSLEVGMRSLDGTLPYRLVQIANDPLERNLEKLKEHARPGTFVTHGTLSSLHPLVARSPSARGAQMG